jgi:hypothetical protein
MWGSMDIGFFLVRCFLQVPDCPQVPLWRKIYLFLTMCGRTPPIRSPRAPVFEPGQAQPMLP